MEQTGKILILIGLLVVVAGFIVYFAGNRFTWFGNLPGDIRIEKEGFRFYAPLISMLLLSGLISLLIWLYRKIF